MSQLYLQLPPLDDQHILSAPIDWLLVEDSGRSTEGQASDIQELVTRLRDAALNLKHVQVIAVIPDHLVLSVREPIPGKTRYRIQQAAPFVIEPYLTTDIEEMHVATGISQMDATTPVAAIERAKIAAYIEACGGELPLAVLTTLSLIDPYSSSKPEIWVAHNYATLRAGHETASVPVDQLNELLDSVDLSSETNQIAIHTGTSDFDVARQVQRKVDLEVVVEEHSPLSYVAQSYDQKQSLNLLQGTFRPKLSADGLAQKWQIAVAAGAVAILSISGLLGVQGLHANSQAEIYHQQAVDVYEVNIGSYAGFANPAELLYRRQQGSRTETSGDFLVLLDRLAQSGIESELVRVSFPGRNGALQFSMTLEDFERLEDITASVSDDEFAVETISAELREEQVYAVLELAQL